MPNIEELQTQRDELKRALAASDALVDSARNAYINVQPIDAGVDEVLFESARAISKLLTGATEVSKAIKAKLDEVDQQIVDYEGRQQDELAS